MEFKDRRTGLVVFGILEILPAVLILAWEVEAGDDQPRMMAPPDGTG